MNAKALMAHLSRYRLDTLSTEVGDGIALVDTGGNPAVATVLLFDENGLPFGGRLSGSRDEIQASIAKLAVDEKTKMQESVLLSEMLDFFGFRGATSTFSKDVASSFLVTQEGAGANRKDVEAAATAWLNANGISDVAKRLDEGALDALSCVSKFKRSAYAFYAHSGDLGRIRRQAAASYPLLAGEISSKLLVKMAVDRMQPLQEVLTKAFGVDDVGVPRLSKALLKRLANRKLTDGGLPAQVIINALSEIPSDWFPKDDAEWATFLDLTDTFFRRLGPDLGMGAKEMAHGVGGKWKEFAARLAKSYAWTQPPEDLDEESKALWKPNIDVSRQAMSEATENARDVIQAFRNLVILPLAANAGQGIPVFVGPEQLRQASDIAGNILYGGKSLTAVLELQRHWHTQAHNIAAAAGAHDLARPSKQVAEDGWPPLTDIVWAPNGVEIYPLTDPRELQDEGACGLHTPGPDRNGIGGLGHCVGGYSTNCRNGTSHIVSFRMPTGDGSFERLSTAEFKGFSPDSTNLECAQHRGKRNGAPPKEAEEAYDWFLASVRDWQIPLNYEGVMTYLSGRRRLAEEVEAYSEYDWREDQAVADALEPWRPYLPKRFKDLDLPALQALPELRDLIQALAPSFGYSVRM